MSETSANVTGQTAEQPPAGEPKTFDAEYVKKLRDEAAKYRTEAKANADAAKRLAEIEEANKTEVQKATERLAAAEKAAADARREALKFKIAARFNIGDEDADLFLTGTDEETLTKQAERLAGRESDRKKNGNVVPKEGAATPPAGADPVREFARGLFATATDS